MIASVVKPKSQPKEWPKFSGIIKMEADGMITLG
jgi:hypothetical protein